MYSFNSVCRHHIALRYRPNEQRESEQARERGEREGDRGRSFPRVLIENRRISLLLFVFFQLAPSIAMEEKREKRLSRGSKVGARGHAKGGNGGGGEFGSGDKRIG